MFNPAYAFTDDLLTAFREKEVIYFVRSTYARGRNELIKEAFLISHYHQQAEAERHYNAIIRDTSRRLYDLSKPGDFERLRDETLQQEGRQSFSKLIHPENEKRATAIFKENTKRYLFRNTNWDLKGKVIIYPKFRFQLGELYVRIVHHGDQIIVPFKDIENS